MPGLHSDAPSMSGPTLGCGTCLDLRWFSGYLPAKTQALADAEGEGCVTFDGVTLRFFGTEAQRVRTLKNVGEKYRRNLLILNSVSKRKYYSQLWR